MINTQKNTNDFIKHIKESINKEDLNSLKKKLGTSMNITRKEKILVLPYNTLRVFDALVQVEIEKAKNPKWYGKLDEVVYDMLTRTEKDLGKHNGVDSNLVHELMEKDWARFYEIAPRTIIYGMIDYLYHQSFVSDIIALFHHKDAYDEALTCDYYDGTIEGLEKYIANNGITAIIMDDVELLKTLIDRGNVDLNWMSIFISKLGYNFYKNKDGRLLMKHMTEIHDKYCIEIACLTLINFTEEFLNRKFGGKKQ